MNGSLSLITLVISILLSLSSEAQRVIVRRSGEQEVTKEGADIRKQRPSKDHIALKLGLSQMIRGEYIGSVEYELNETFSVEGGLGLTFTSVNFVDDLFFPFYDLDGRGFSFMIGGKLYSDSDVMDDDYYHGLYFSRRVYNYGRTFFSVPEWYGSGTISTFTYNFGYSSNISDFVLLEIGFYGGVLMANFESAEEFLDGTYYIETNNNRELSLTFGMTLQLGIFI